jgi:hypothetical protein
MTVNVPAITEEIDPPRIVGDHRIGLDCKWRWGRIDHRFRMGETAGKERGSEYAGERCARYFHRGPVCAANTRPSRQSRSSGTLSSVTESACHCLASSERTACVNARLLRTADGLACRDAQPGRVAKHAGSQLRSLTQADLGLAKFLRRVREQTRHTLPPHALEGRT